MPIPGDDRACVMASEPKPAASAPFRGVEPAPSSGAAVVLECVHKSFGSVIAVDDLNLRIEPGEFITLLGPSGSGKTTTLMMIAGFDSPSRGEMYIDGQPIVGVPPYRRG